MSWSRRREVLAVMLSASWKRVLVGTTEALVMLLLIGWVVITITSSRPAELAPTTRPDAALRAGESVTVGISGKTSYAVLDGIDHTINLVRLDDGRLQITPPRDVIINTVTTQTGGRSWLIWYVRPAQDRAAGQPVILTGKESSIGALGQSVTLVIRYET